MFGHSDIQQVKDALKNMGMTTTSKQFWCLPCVLAKAKQKVVAKEDVTRSNKPGQ